jgi:hypothetical protein
MTPEERTQMNALSIRIQEEKNYDRYVTLLSELSNLVERKAGRFGRSPHHREWQRKKPWRTVPATVKKIFKSAHPSQPEKVEILIETADELFREIRIENTLIGVDGGTVALTDGAHLDVTFEADPGETTARPAKATV